MENREKQRCSVCFIILNYNEIELTKKCVKSIFKLENAAVNKSDAPQADEPYVIILDNASPNGCGEQLFKEYESNNRVKVILNKENSGFAAGNNIAFSYAKENIDADFIIAVNSDVLFIQHGFVRKLFDLYEEYPFHVAGPDILIPDRCFHQNPRMTVDGYPSVEQVYTMKREWEASAKHLHDRDMFAFKKYVRERYRFTWWMRALFRIKRTLEQTVSSVHHKSKGPIKLGASSDSFHSTASSPIENENVQLLDTVDINKHGLYKKQLKNVCLQGPCIIFDRRYIAERDVLFNPLTFMYFEEQILCLDCYLNNWKTIYFPQLKVVHLDSGSTYNGRMGFEEFCQKKEQSYRRGIEGTDVYLEYLGRHLLSDE